MVECGVSLAQTVVEVAGHRFPEIFESPAGDDHIIAEYEVRGYDGEAADERPFRAGRQTAERAGGVIAAGSAERELGQHHGDAEQQDAGYIENQKGRTAVVLCLGRETPYISQSDGRAHGRCDQSYF